MHCESQDERDARIRGKLKGIVHREVVRKVPCTHAEQHTADKHVESAGHENKVKVFCSKDIVFGNKFFQDQGSSGGLSMAISLGASWFH